MSKLLMTLVAAPLAVVSTCALAMDSIATTPVGSTPTVRAPSKDAEPPDNVNLSLVEAVKAAHAQMQGRVLGIRFEMWHGQPTYLVRIYTSRSVPAVWQGRISADTALPVGQPTMLWSHEWNARLRNNIVALRDVHIPLGQVVRKAEKAHSGHVIMAAVRALPNGRAAYRLNLVSNDQVRVLTIGARNMT